MLVTKHVIDYQAAPYGHIATIPVGTPVEPATNLPIKETEIPLYWVKPWKGMTPEAESWQRNYGFLVDWCDVENFISRLPRLDTLTDAELNRWCYAKV